MHNTALLVSRTSRTALAVRLAFAAALIPAWAGAQATAHHQAYEWKGPAAEASAPRQTTPGQSPGAPSVRKPGAGHEHH